MSEQDELTRDELLAQIKVLQSRYDDVIAQKRRQQLIRLLLPLPSGGNAELTVMSPMPLDDWLGMMNILDAMKLGIIEVEQEVAMIEPGVDVRGQEK